MSRTTEAKKKLRQASYNSAQERKSARKTDHQDNFRRAQGERKLNDTLGCGRLTNSQVLQRAKYYERLIETHGAGHFKDATAVHAIIEVANLIKIRDEQDA